MKAGRLLRILAILVVLAVVLLMGGLLTYVTWPLPPPKVSIKFVGFENRGTNQFAIIRMTNEGQQTIWPSAYWTAYIETASGWVTHQPSRPLSSIVVVLGLEPSSNR